MGSQKQIKKEIGDHKPENLKFEDRGRVQTIVFPAKFTSTEERVTLVGDRTHLEIEIGLENFHFGGEISNSLLLYQVSMHIYSV